ncbi:N(2)-acetyl-L-2,4-diaminobutanoate deacetylase DoeB [Pseudomonas putida]|uniref:N(2)-acetyl-L-2,4-diaminobutanoate deacetylase DoeB n=1 Tax=Pseudomonas putida TaxID=303 RepID=UPI00300ED610
MKPSPIKPTVDFERDGVQHGFLKLPYSRDDSAWGSIMIPVTVVKNGSGPTVLLTGGNHGDEYEGPVALTKLSSKLQAEDVKGRVIIIPFMNFPAFKAGTRTSPIDRGNLNRTFPGKPDGTVTEKIADYIQRFILPMADYVLDIHSGGKTLDFVPFAAVHVLPDKIQQHRGEQAMQAFAAPFSMMMVEIDSVGMFDTAVEEAGKVFVTTELGGGGSSTATTIAIAERGVRNFLIHTGVVAGEITPAGECVMLDMPDGDCFITSEHAGLIELCFNLGDPIRGGDVVARIYDATRTGVPPVEYLAKRDGVLACRHFPGLVQCGDTIAVLGVIV